MADKIAQALKDRIAEIKTVDLVTPDPDDDSNQIEWEGVIQNFGLFIDTHRDQPHIGSFHEDIHRGQSRPTLVHYDPDGDWLIEASSGKLLKRHPKHMFITEEWFADWMLERMIQGEGDPRDEDGVMLTSHLRDSRAKVYVLKSFRQIVMERWVATKA